MTPFLTNYAYEQSYDEQSRSATDSHNIQRTIIIIIHSFIRHTKTPPTTIHPSTSLLLQPYNTILALTPGRRVENCIVEPIFI